VLCRFGNGADPVIAPTLQLNQKAVNAFAKSATIFNLAGNWLDEKITADRFLFLLNHTIICAKGKNG
jgi:hypothetical protein